jgi:hypothetical protein
VFATFLLLTESLFASTRTPGTVCFYAFSGIAFLFWLFEGLRQSDCLSAEKRAGTPGYALLATLPIFALPLLMGGVTGAEFWRMVLLLLNTLFFALACATLISSRSRSQQKAWLGTVLLLGGITAGFPLLPPLLAGLRALIATFADSPLHPMIDQFLNGLATLRLASPVTTLYLAAPGKAMSGNYWISLASVHVLGWIFLAGASYFLPRNWQERPQETPVRALQKGKTLTSPHRQLAVTKAKRWLEIDPVVWLVLRQHDGLLRTTILVAVIATIILQALVSACDNPGAARSIGWPVSWALRIWVAFEACRFFSEIRRNEGLELLLATPLTTRDMVRGHLQALWRLCRWPILLYLTSEVVLTIMSLSADFQLRYSWALGAGRTLILEPLTFLADLLAAIYFGMWLSLTIKKPNRAFAFTVLAVLLVPSLIPCFPEILSDIGFILWGQYRLRNDFRRSKILGPK